ncbi:uncharacterized protein LOC110033565 isoform X2 [Phalaenopsis equestris]|uniref:uncharacterized protein LOC110033565 isoform X2 n=1 Tax=Phalaenopsis equestris TaxID=78828 RepID=UPI0009E60857|nr:uncharacterized protein LOC110033565 isoform X2 [Phalaenopsis equestris]
MKWESDPEDFSPSATIVPFDPPLPLLRAPMKAGLGDRPSAGSFVLAFKDAASWRSAFRATESKILEQCEVSGIIARNSPFFWIFVSRLLVLQLAELAGFSLARQ